MLDIEVNLDVLELIHAAAGGEGVEVLFRILSGHSESSELVVNVPVHGSRACCSTNSDIPTLGMASKFSLNSAFTFFSLMFLPV